MLLFFGMSGEQHMDESALSRIFEIHQNTSAIEIQIEIRTTE
jgi:hypothetical protein